jgi:hypothetical protein
MIYMRHELHTLYLPDEQQMHQNQEAQQEEQELHASPPPPSCRLCAAVWGLPDFLSSRLVSLLLLYAAPRRPPPPLPLSETLLDAETEWQLQRQEVAERLVLVVLLQQLCLQLRRVGGA